MTEKYKSQYPTLQQAKTHWSKPVDPFARLKKFKDFHHLSQTAKDKLAASRELAIMGNVHQKIHEEDAAEHIYHVTHTKHVEKIQKHGILPMKTSNWVKAGDKARYGNGEVYAFTHRADAEAWAGRMDWAHHQKLGSGKISIITAKRPADRKFERDENDPLSQAGKKGDWLKTHGSIEPHHIVSVEPYHPKKLGEDKVAVFQFDTQLQNVRMKETGVKRKKKMKDPRPTDFRRSDKPGFRESVESKANSEWIEKHELDKPAKKKIKEAKDRIGKPTPSAEEIAKKHKLPLDKIEAQIKKGIEVEKEHTPDEREAHEIARDHLDEFPDYYDRLGAMEKAAKKEMKKEGWNPDVEQIRLRIDSHKKVAEKMAQKHGEQSQEAAFHRAYVKHLSKELKDVHGLDEAKKNPMKGFKMMKNDPPLPPPKKPFPVPKGYERVKDIMGFNVLRKLKEEVPNSVGGGNIAGMPTHSTPDQTPVRRKPKILRRDKFAGKTVFEVDEDTYYKAYLGKRKYEHYEKFLEGCEGYEEIRDYGRKYWDEPILIRNQKTGAMQYLKYGSK